MSENATFTGTVIDPGSPHDGCVQEASGPTMRMGVMTLASGNYRSNTTTYIFEKLHVHVHGGDRGDRVWGFWLPEGRTHEYLMDALVEAYQRRAGTMNKQP